MRNYDLVYYYYYHPLFYIMKYNYKTVFVISIVIFLYTRPRYIPYLPTLPFYENDEAKEVVKRVKMRNSEDVQFFELTNPSVIYAFLPYVNETEQELRDITKRLFITVIILFLKYLINRPRPYQIIPSIDYLESDTGYTPSLPAGHALQAYYLSYILSRQYPDKKQLFDKLAEKCDDVRVKAGIHYPSDGKLSKNIVNYMIRFSII